MQSLANKKAFEIKVVSDWDKYYPSPNLHNYCCSKKKK